MGHICSHQKIIPVWNFEISQQQITERIWLRAFSTLPKSSLMAGLRIRSKR